MRIMKFLAIPALAMLLYAAPAGALDGIALTTHWTQDASNAIHAPRFGNIIRHDIQGSRVMRSTPIYTLGDAGYVCIAPTGDRLAFVRRDGAIVVIGINGEDPQEVARFTTGLKDGKLERASGGIQWPYGEDGQWIYYMDPPGDLRRVNVATRQAELVIRFNRASTEFGLSLYATPHTGLFTCRPAESEACIYDMAADTGDLWACPRFGEGEACGMSASPDGAFIAANNGGHTLCRIADRSAKIKTVFTLNKWAGNDADGARLWQFFRWSVNSMDWIAVTQGGGGMGQDPVQWSNAVIYNWVKGDQIQVTRNGRGEFDYAGGLWDAAAPVELALGLHTGEAPFTPSFPAVPPGKWSWNFGDGKTAGPGGAAAPHVYRKPGSYAVTATQGGRTLHGRVTVLEQRAPTATVQMADESRLLVRFDEPVRPAADARIELKSGTPVARTVWAEDGRSLLIQLDGRLAKDDALLVAGIADRAQVPNKLRKSSLPAPTRGWASEPGIVFLWEAAGKPSLRYDNELGTFTDACTVAWKAARPDRDGGFALNGGAVFAVNAADAVVRECTAKNAFTIHAVIVPANIYQGNPADARRIIGCNRHYGGIDNVNFALGQQADKLVLDVRTRQDAKDRDGKVHRVELCPLASQTPNCVIVSFKPGTLACYLNGKLVKQTDAIPGNLFWGESPDKTGLHFGGREDVPYPWRGTLKAVAISTSFVDSEAAASDYAALSEIIRKRTNVPQIELLARLRAATPVPNPADILPYRAALVVNEYDVEQIASGKYRKKTVRVAQWGIIDGERMPVARAKPGEPARLVLEPWADHPELESEQQIDSLPEDLDLPLYVDVTVEPSGEPRAAVLKIIPQEVWLPPGQNFQFKTAVLDQYGNPIECRLRWSAEGRGHISGPYGAGAHFTECRQPGEGTVDATGLFTIGKPGTVTVTVRSEADPAIHASAVVGIGSYPAANPSADLPLRFGLHSSEREPFIGDIDRIRFYSQALTADEIARHARGDAMDTADANGLTGDWTFDQPAGDSYPNVAGDGLAAKVIGDVQHVEEGGIRFVRRFVRLNGKGRLDVAPDPRLNVSTAFTIEAWVRPATAKKEGCIVSRERVWGWGFHLGWMWGRLGMDMLRGHFSGPLLADCTMPTDGWTYVAAVFDVGGGRRLFVNGKLIGEQLPQPFIIRQ